MKSSLKPLLAALAILVAGCMETQPTTAVSRGDVRPGTHQVDGIIASGLFGQICVETSPKFSRTRSVIAALPFMQHPETGTYYHQNLDLSVKLTNGANDSTCSMVFASKDSPMQLSIIMSVAAGSPSIGIDPSGHSSSTTLPNGAQMRFLSVGRTAGKNYYTAAINAAN